MSEKSVWLFLFILLYAAFCFFWGVRGSKFNSENPQKYYLADKNVSSWVFFFAATAATFAGLTIISQSSLIFNDPGTTLLMTMRIFAMCRFLFQLNIT